MDIEEVKSHVIVFRAYQRLLLLELNRMKEAIQNGEKMSVTEILDRLIADTQLSLAD